MKEAILKVLEQLKIKDYTLNIIRRQSQEYFFIKRKLDLSRAKDVTFYDLTVYKRNYDTNRRYMGESQVRLFPNMAEAELQARIAAAYEQAGYVKNEYFDLPVEKKADIPQFTPSKDLVATILSFPDSADVHLNSFEAFDENITVETLNSKGMDVWQQRREMLAEVVLTAVKGRQEAEIMNQFCYGHLNETDLFSQLGKLRDKVHDRLHALPLSTLTQDVPVLLSHELVLPLTGALLQRLSAKNIYNHTIDIKIGERIGPEHFSLTGLAYLEDSSKNHLYDEEGCLVKDLPLVIDGKAQNFWGENRYGQYLKLDDISMVYNYKAGGGTLDLESLKQNPYLEVVECSNFFCDYRSGDYGMEIRLAYYFDGENITPLTGGSLTGNFLDALTFSKELEKHDGAVVPQAVLLSSPRLAK